MHANIGYATIFAVEQPLCVRGGAGAFVTRVSEEWIVGIMQDAVEQLSSSVILATHCVYGDLCLPRFYIFFLSQVSSEFLMLKRYLRWRE